MEIPVRKMGSEKNIALVAHDNKKSELIEWAVYNKVALRYAKRLDKPDQSIHSDLSPKK